MLGVLVADILGDEDGVFDMEGVAFGAIVTVTISRVLGL